MRSPIRTDGRNKEKQAPENGSTDLEAVKVQGLGQMGLNLQS